MSVVGCVLVLLAPARALAQHVVDGASSARIRVGPLGLTPRIAIRNLGVDSNVRHSTDDARKDFTVTFVPELESWMRLGRARFQGRTTAEWMYFGRSVSERSIGRGQSGSAELRLNSFTPYGAVSYLRTEQSSTLEIADRLPQSNSMRRLGVSATLSPTFRFDVEGQQQSYRLVGITPESAQYASSLNRDVTTFTVSGNYGLTPLTTLVVRTSVLRDRFALTPLRNSNSVSVTPGFEFKPFALVSGTLFVGYRKFSALDADVPDYAGLTASINVRYVIREMTKVMVGFRRELEYSFEQTQPYYLATGTDVSVVQMLGPGWDVVGRAGRSALAYRNVLSAATPDGRKDRIATWGIGAGRHLPSGLRVGFDVDYLRRVSMIDGRGFHGVRFGGSVTYGS
jgi:hypothetical protein